MGQLVMVAAVVTAVYLEFFFSRDDGRGWVGRSFMGCLTPLMRWGPLGERCAGGEPNA